MKRTRRESIKNQTTEYTVNTHIGIYCQLLKIIKLIQLLIYAFSILCQIALQDLYLL